MAKLALLPLLLVVGCLTAGLFGALHDQVSYSVSPDYFHAFKFHQFQIPPHLHNRVGAAIVGWRASWWMGPIIGVPLLTAGLLLPDWRAYLKHSWLSAWAPWRLPWPRSIKPTCPIFGIPTAPSTRSLSPAPA